MAVSQHDFDPAKSSSSCEDFLAFREPTPDWFCELNEIPYGATPLTWTYHAEQDGCMRDRLRELCENPPEHLGLSKTVIEAVTTDFYSGITARQVRNYEKFSAWMENNANEYENFMHDSSLSSLIERAKVGAASPADLITLMQHSSGLEATTLASLSMPYGYRAKQYPTMITAVETSISNFGGEIYDAAQRGVYRVKDFGFHRAYEQVSGTKSDDELRTAPWAKQQLLAHNIAFKTGDIEAILVTYKRKIGRFPADHDIAPKTTCEVRERISSVIACGLPDFPKNVYRCLQSNQNSNEYRAAEEFLKKQIMENRAVPYILPISSSIYAVRETEPTEYNPAVKVPYSMGRKAFIGSKNS